MRFGRMLMRWHNAPKLSRRWLTKHSKSNIVGSVHFSRAECAALSRMLDGGDAGLDEKPLKAFQEKLDKLKAAVPAEAPEDLAPPTQES